MRRLSMHTEAVDAGVFGVAPVAQHPELHQLVCAYGITLGERKKEKPELLRALEGSETPDASLSSWGQVLQGQSAYLEVKCLDGVAVVVVGELPQEKALLLSLLLQALWGSREAESENRGGQRGRTRGDEHTQDGRGRCRHKHTQPLLLLFQAKRDKWGQGPVGRDEGGKWKIMPFPLMFPKTLPKTPLPASYCFLLLFRLTPTPTEHPTARYGAH